MWALAQPSSQEQVVNNLVKKFNAQYPGGGHVQITWVGGEAWKQKLVVAMAAHNPPTIFYSSGGQLLEQYVKSGGVASASPELSADPQWKSQYAANNVWDLATFDGQIYGIPAGGPDFETMWQNAGAITKAGGTPAPKTWDEFTADIGKLKAAGIAPITIAGKDLWPEMIWMQYLTLRFGGRDAFNGVLNGTPGSWSNPAILKAAETIQTLVKQGAFVKGFNTLTFASGEADKLLADGKAGFQAQLYFDSANMRTFAPDFALSPDFLPSVFPSVPGGTGNPGDLVGQPAQYFSVSNYASDAAKKEAFAWLKYETTSTEYNVDFLVKNGYTPITAVPESTMRSVKGGELLSKLFQMGTTAPYLQPYWDQNLPSAEITPMLTAIGEVFDLTITPQQFADTMNKVLAGLPK
jgi:raffinose/stachyose/melibiose transport system substrate-binding protein